MADNRIGPHTWGPEDRIVGAQLGKPTVRCSATVINGLFAIGNTLSVAVSEEAGAPAYRYVLKAEYDGIDRPKKKFSLSFTPVSSPGTRNQARIAADTIRRMAEANAVAVAEKKDAPYAKMPTDVYAEYQALALELVGSIATHHRSAVCISRTPNDLSEKLCERVYSTTVTGVPLCNGGLGTSNTGGTESYTYGQHGLTAGVATVPQPYYRKESPQALRYDPAIRSFVLEHVSWYRQPLRATQTVESSNVTTRNYGSYGTFNVWDTCEYPQVFTNVSTVKETSTTKYDDSRAMVIVQESPIPLDTAARSGSRVSAKLRLVITGLEANMPETCACVVTLSALGKSTTVQGDLRLVDAQDGGDTLVLTLTEYNPFNIQLSADYCLYNDIIPAKGFILVSACSGRIALDTSRVVRRHRFVEDMFDCAVEFFFDPPAWLLGQCWFWLENESAEAIALQNPGYAISLFLRRQGVTSAVTRASPTALGLLARGDAIPLELRPSAVLLDADVGPALESNAPVDGPFGVSVLPHDSRRGQATKTYTSTMSWPIMSPWGMEGSGSGADTTIQNTTADEGTLVCSSLSTLLQTSPTSIPLSAFDTLSFSRLSYGDKDSTASQSGNYTNSYARPINKTTESDSYTTKATPVRSTCHIPLYNKAPAVVSFPPAQAVKSRTTTISRPAEYGAVLDQETEETVFPSLRKEQRLLKFDGSTYTVCVLVSDSITRSTRVVGGVTVSSSLGSSGGTTVESPLDSSLFGMSKAAALLPIMGIVEERLFLLPYRGIAYGSALLCGADISRENAVVNPPFVAPVPVSGKSPRRYASVNGTINLSGPYIYYDYSRTFENGSTYSGYYPDGDVIVAINIELGYEITRWYESTPGHAKVPWQGSQEPWYFVVIPYRTEGGVKYYGDIIYTSPTLRTPVAPSAQAFVCNQRTVLSSSEVGINAYYGGSPPGEPPSAISSTETTTTSYQYQDVFVSPPSIGMSVDAFPLDIEGANVTPFIWYSTIAGAEGYCVGYRSNAALKIQQSYSLLNKPKYEQVVHVLEAMAEVWYETAASLAESEHPSERREGLTSYLAANMVVEILSAFTAASSTATKENREPWDKLLLWGIYVSVFCASVRLVRNDFASSELLASVTSETTGVSFIQQQPLKPYAGSERKSIRL